MTRQTQFLLAAILLELMVVAIAVPLMRWDAISAGLAAAASMRRVTLVQLVQTVAPPIELGVVWAIVRRRLSSNSPRLADSHRGYHEAGLLVIAFFLLATQAWFASHLGHGRATGVEPLARMGTIFAGMVMAIQGNFTAKAPPPTGDRAPDEIAWALAARRCGWVLCILGLALAIGAITLPMPLVAFSVPAIWLLAAGCLLAHRRAFTQPSVTPRATS
jgi:hypothetical protein